MTKSAKRGTAKVPPGQAGPESAATRQDIEPPQETAPPAEDGARSGGTPAAAVAGGPATDDGTTPDLDEVKRKFREALDRKRDAHKASQDKGGRAAGKVNGAHGPAASRRSFRRKSG